MAIRSKIRKNGCNSQIKPDNVRPNFPSTGEISGLAYVNLPPKMGTNKRMIVMKKKEPSPNFGFDSRSPVQLALKFWNGAKPYIYINLFFWMLEILFFDEGSDAISYTFLLLAMSVSFIIRKQYEERTEIDKSTAAFLPRGIFSRKFKAAVRRNYTKHRRFLYYAQQYTLYCLIITLDTWFLKITIWGSENPPRRYIRLWMVIQPWLTLKIHALFKMRVFPNSVLLQTLPVSSLWQK